MDSKSLNDHVLTRSPLAYPAIAKAAQVQGTVVVEVIVDDKGAVASTKVISGPPMLIQAAIDCVKTWTYRPFEKEGQPVPALGQVSLIFTLGNSASPPAEAPAGQTSATKTVTITFPSENLDGKPDADIAKRYFTAFHDCTKGVLGGVHDAETASLCKQAADIAQQFAPNTRYIEKRSSAVYAATAIANSGDLKGALIYADKAVEIVELGHDDNSGSNAAYSTRGTLEGLLGNYPAADRDLNLAEEYERRAIASLASDSPGHERELQTSAETRLELPCANTSANEPLGPSSSKN